MIPRREFLRRACVLTGLALCGCSAARTNLAREALQSAIAFVVSKQSADGAWRSTKYAAFRDGDALTPLVLWALQYSADPSAATAIARGGEWLRRLTNERAWWTEPWTGLNYPLFTFAYSAQFFATMGDSGRADLCAYFVELLRIRESLGWPAGDPACGAWSDSPMPPELPKGVHPPPDMIAPNISATVLALQALTAAGRKADCRAALPFVEKCQNYSPDAADPFSDGGFFFAIGDPIRNKAGIAGSDAEGQQRFRSYGSATCDGLLALQRCGLPDNDPRQLAAVVWLTRNVQGMEHGGAWPRTRLSARESLTFYFAQSLAEVIATSPAHHSPLVNESRSLALGLCARQEANGSWVGEAPESCEDDAIVATAFAIRTLTRLESVESVSRGDRSVAIREAR
jgi:hypothetical protein